jgi:hypothetical protein
MPFDPEAIAASLTNNVDDACALAWALSKDEHMDRETLEADLRAALAPILAKYPRPDEMSPDQYAAHLAAMTALVVRTEQDKDNG